jgi:hypothetical protein
LPCFFDAIIGTQIDFRGQTIAVVGSAYPVLYPVGIGFLALGALLWLWDAATSP